MEILIVEDDPRIADFLCRGLEGESHRPVWHATGAAGVTAALSSGFSQIILDLMLPDMTGIDACRQLRAAGIATPILMLTAMSDVRDRVNGLQAGADDYLTKPFAFSELLARIDALSRRAARGPQHHAVTLIRAGNVELDPEAHEVRCAGRPVNLTAKEFALLRLLMERAGRVVSRSAILDQVWGYDADPLTNVVDVYVRHLRTKLDPGRTVSLITTVRGAGYKLNATPHSAGQPPS